MNTEFKGTKQADKYAIGKSSSRVFQEAHKRDFLAGYNQALEDSFAPEMLEVLKTIENDNNQIPGWLWSKIQSVIQKATTL